MVYPWLEQFGPDAFCLLEGGMKHPPAGIRVVGEGPVPMEEKEAVGTWGHWQLSERGLVPGGGRSAVGHFHSTCGNGAGMPSLERARNKVGMCKV